MTLSEPFVRFATDFLASNADSSTEPFLILVYGVMAVAAYSLQIEENGLAPIVDIKSFPDRMVVVDPKSHLLKYKPAVAFPFCPDRRHI